MAGIKDFSTTAANNTTVGSISVAEGMLPSNINNAFRGLAAEIREWYNDSQWVIYGDGDGSFTITYASATSFTVAAVDVTGFYHVGRRVKAIATTPGTIFGTISATTFSTNTTVTVTWDSGSLANEAVTIYVGALSKTNDSIPELVITNAKISASAAIDATKIGGGVVSNTEFSYLDGVTSAIQTQINAKQTTDAELTAIAGLTSAADKGIQFTGSGTAAVFDLTTAGKALLDDADASTQRTTLGLGTIATQNANNVALTGGSITGLGSPSSGSDAATKTYVDNLITGLKTRIICRAASTADVTIASALENGDTLDGITLVTGDRVLLKNQTTDSQNGIYTVVASGSASRDTEFDSIIELAGQLVIIQEGTVNADTFHLCTTDTSATLGSSSITFTKVTPSNSGTVTSVVAGTGLTGGTITSSGTLAIDTGVVTTLTGTQTLTNKTLTSPIISSISNTGTLTLPTSTDTLVGKATTDTLTNKTLTLPTIDNIKIGYSTTATAAGTTTLTVSSNYKQYFTGSTTQTIVLPVVSTLTLGHTFEIHNNSSGSLTINSSGSNLVGTVEANMTAACTCILVTGTTAASWDFDVTGFTSALPVTRGGTGLTALGTSLQSLRVNSGATALEFATASAGFSGATTTSSAVDITLTSASTQVQNVTMTAADKAVILPDATTLTTKGFPVFVIINDGVYPFSIKNNSGAVIVNVSPSNSVELNLISNSTSAGVFAKEDAPINISSTPFTTVKTGTTGTTGITYAYGVFKLDGISASAISSTSALITYHAGTSNRDIYGVVVSYSGTTITVNSETLLYSGTTTASTLSQGLMLSATNGFLFVQRASNHVVVPFTISGTTITAGTASSTFGIGTSTASASMGVAIAMTSTEALLPLRDNAANPTFVLRNIIHNGASAPTLGTASSVITASRADYALGLLSKIDSTNAFLTYRAGGNSYSAARVVTISGGSAPTLGTANTSSVSQLSDDAINSSLFKVSSTEFIVIGGSGSENYTVSGTTVSYTGVELHSTVNASETANTYAYCAGQLTFGNNMLIHGRDVGTFVIKSKLGNFFHVKQKLISLSRTFIATASNGTNGFAWENLDSTTGIGVTNNNGTTTIAATIIKYIGT